MAPNAGSGPRAQPLRSALLAVIMRTRSRYGHSGSLAAPECGQRSTKSPTAGRSEPAGRRGAAAGAWDGGNRAPRSPKVSFRAGCASYLRTQWVGSPGAAARITAAAREYRQVLAAARH
jgi:hypothetical protein